MHECETIECTYVCTVLCHSYQYFTFDSHICSCLLIFITFMSVGSEIFGTNFKSYTHVHLCIMAVLMNNFDKIWSISYLAAVYVILLSHFNNPWNIFVRKFRFFLMCIYPCVHLLLESIPSILHLAGIFSLFITFIPNNSLNSLLETSNFTHVCICLVWIW